MKKINKKGFTLIELLAVIVVLAIVLVVTIPSVLSSMKDARSKQFENAVLSVKEWFEKQYDTYTRLGEEYANDKFVEYLNGSLNEKCGDLREEGLTEEQKKEILKCRTSYKTLTSDVIVEAGLDPADIDYDSSYVAFSEKGEVEINLVSTEYGKFSNNGTIAVASSSDYTNLIDFNKRIGVTGITKNQNNALVGQTISTDSYYYAVSAGYFRNSVGGSTAKFVVDNDNPLVISNEKISFKLGDSSGYGILVPVKLDPNSEYKLSYTSSNTVSLARIEEYYENGKYNKAVNITDGIIKPNKDTSIVTGILFYCSTAYSTADFSNIKLTKIS